ncbi:MAG TPA: hypothetical protein VEH49_04835, partial [Methylomirabilota bacterium]|nr:hypothetical protein [Methylomirabilota bacterium]
MRFHVFVLRIFLCLALCTLASAIVPEAERSQAGAPAALHTATLWDLKPSLKFDTLCLLNALTGDPYYLRYYRAEYDRFSPQLTPAERDAFLSLKRILKDEAGGIISAQLSLYFSLAEDESLSEMIRTARDSSEMRAALLKTQYWSPGGWGAYERARPHLETALKALQRLQFESYWEKEARPRILKRIEELRPTLAKYNIVPSIERKLGGALASDHITVYLLLYSEPHGIRITGARFLTHVSYPFGIVLHNAIHEMMHPPYDAKDPAVSAAIDRLAAEPLIKDKVEHHDASF